MEIRKMTIQDYEKVYELWMSCKNMGFNDIDDSKEGISRFLERNPNTSFVAIQNEKLIGIILGGHDGRRGYIYHLSVNENYRKKSIGSELVKNCLDAFKQEKQGFILREDINYRNVALRELVRIDT